MGTIRKRGRGQGMVEFAMVLPLLLLVFVGIAEFGRIFAIYSNLFNAAREATRYGFVNPGAKLDIVEVAERAIFLVDPAKVTVEVYFDSGPGTADTGQDHGEIGDRVVVRLYYDVEPMVPLLRPLLSNLYVETIAARTISSGTPRGGGYSEYHEPTGPLPGPPTVEIIEPDEGRTVYGVYTVFVKAVDDGTVTGVELSIAGGAYVSMTQLADAPDYYSYPWDTTVFTADVSISLQARATDDLGEIAESAVVNVIVGSAVDVPDTRIRITTEVWEGDTFLSGTADPGSDLFLRDIQSGNEMGGVSDEDGGFSFITDGGWLVGGHVIVVGYPWGGTERLWDFAVVRALLPTATPTVTPVPGVKDIWLSVTCVSTGTTSIEVTGWDWPNADVVIKHRYPITETTETQVGSLAKGDFLRNFVLPITVTIGATDVGTHTITGYYEKSTGLFVAGESAEFVVPCPSDIELPTTYPNLVVESFELLNTGAISTHVPLTFTVSVSNTGDMAATSLFWVDLFVDPTEVISPTNPPGDGVVWTAIGSQEAHTSTLVTLYHHSGFPVTGTHVAYALVDPQNYVGEDSELDNLSVPLTITVSGEGTPPEPPEPPAGDGTILGMTYLSIHGDAVPHGRVKVYCYDSEDALIAEAVSDEFGDYALENIPAGAYAVIGETFINDQLYSDVVVEVVVAPQLVTLPVVLVLH